MNLAIKLRKLKMENFSTEDLSKLVAKRLFSPTSFNPTKRCCQLTAHHADDSDITPNSWTPNTEIPFLDTLLFPLLPWMIKPGNRARET